MRRGSSEHAYCAMTGPLFTWRGVAQPLVVMEGLHLWRVVVGNMDDVLLCAKQARSLLQGMRFIVQCEAVGGLRQKLEASLGKHVECGDHAHLADGYDIESCLQVLGHQVVLSLIS